MSKVLFSKAGETDVIGVAPFDMRLSRIRSRVKAWEWVVLDLKAKFPGARLLRITLTYAENGAWSPKDISRYLDKLRKRYSPQQLMAYAWAAELQERGAVHYHVMVVVQKEVFIDTPDSSGDWPHGSSSIERVDNFSANYLTKYLQKGRQKDDKNGGFPKGLRIFAVVVRLTSVLTARTRFDFFISGWPRYVREKVRCLRQKLELRGHSCYSVRRKGGDENGWWWGALPGGGVLLHYFNLYWVVFSEWAYVGVDELDTGNWGKGADRSYVE